MIVIDPQGVGAFAQSLAISVIILLVGYLISKILLPKIKRLEKILLAYPIFFVFVYILYLTNAGFGGVITPNRGLIALTTTLIAAAFAAKNASRKNLRSLIDFLQSHIALASILILGLVVFSQPIYTLPSGVVWLGGDMRRFIAMVSQLLIGKPTAISLYKGLGESTYPWLFPASLSTLSAIFRQDAIGQMYSIFQAYNTIGIITIIWGLIAIYSLSSTVFNGEKTKIYASVILGFLSGGWDLVIENNGVFSFGVNSPLDTIDFPYNGAYTFIPPAWPRQVGYIAYITTLYFLVKLFDNETIENRRIYVIWAGITLGISGLLQPVPVLITGVAMAFYFAYNLLKRKIMWEIPLVGVVSAIFLSPWIISFILTRVDAEATTLMGAVDLPLWRVVLTLGQTLVLSIIGLVLSQKRGNHRLSKINSVVGFHVLVLLGLIVTSNISSIAGFELILFGEYFLRQHRFWFLLYPIMALYAGYAFGEIIEKLKPKNPESNPTLIISTKNRVIKKQIKWVSSLYVVIIALGVIGPALISNAATESMQRSAIASEFREEKENIISTINSSIGPNDVIAAPASISDYMASFTGGYIIYSARLRSNITQEDTPSQKERLNDVTTLLATRSTADQRETIITKYQITYIVSRINIEFSPGVLVEAKRGTFQGITYNLYIVDYTKISIPEENQV